MINIIITPSIEDKQFPWKSEKLGGFLNIKDACIAILHTVIGLNLIDLREVKESIMSQSTEMIQCL